MVEWQAQEVGLDFDAQGQGRGQGMTASAREAREAWVAEYSVGLNKRENLNLVVDLVCLDAH